MQAPSRWFGLPWVLLVVLVAFLPHGDDAEAGSLSVQARAIQAFQDSAQVLQAIDKARSRPGYQTVQQAAPVAVMLSESCGVAGCYYAYFVSQLLSPGEVVNAQSTSVSAVVKISPARHATVSLVNLADPR